MTVGTNSSKILNMAPGDFLKKINTEIKAASFDESCVINCLEPHYECPYFHDPDNVKCDACISEWLVKPYKGGF